MISTKIKRLLLILFLYLLKIILILTIVFLSPDIQSFLARKCVSFLSLNYGINASIDKLYFKLPNKIVLENINLNDSIGENLISADKIFISIGLLDIKNMNFIINELKLEKPYINFYTDSLGNTNISYLINKFSSEDTTSTEFNIKCKKFTLNDACFKYKNFYNIDKNNLTQTNILDTVFNYNNIQINGITTSFSDFKFDGDTISVNILNFSCNEKFSGLTINNLSTYYKYYPAGMIFDDLKLLVNNSKLISSHAELIGKDENYWSDIQKKLSIKLDLDTLLLEVSDLSLFMPKYKNVHETIIVSGKFSGKFSKIKINNLNIFYGKNTNLAGDLSIDGLPDYNETFLFGNISNLSSTIGDVKKILKIVNPENTIEIPKNLNALTYINFKGNITGLMNDFVAYGLFNSNIGSIRTDIALISDFETEKYTINGKLAVNKIRLGEILEDTATFGNISLNSTIVGGFDSKSNYKFQLSCKISEAGLLGYNYSNIDIIGNLQNNSFDGKINIEDENIYFKFDGKYIFSEGFKYNDLKFRAELAANLSALKLVADTLNSNIKMSLNSDIRGDFTSFPDGKFRIDNLKFSYDNRFLNLTKFVLNSFKENDQQFFTIRSDYCDINFYGHFLFNETYYKLRSMFYSYLPAIFSEADTIAITQTNKFNYSIQLSDINNITQVFIPQLFISKDVFMEGEFNSDKSKFTASISVPQIKYDSLYIWGSQLDISALDGSTEIFFSNQEISSDTRPFFENLNLQTILTKNTALLNLDWNNNDSIENSGALKIKTEISRAENKNLPLINNTIFPSKFVINNIDWKLSESNINIDPNELNFIISNFKVEHNEQYLSLQGEISKNKDKILNLALSNINIEIINPYIESSGYQISGILSGSGRVADVYNSMSLRSLLSINNLKVNDFSFGRFDLSGVWNGISNEFNIEGNNRYLKMKGSYIPALNNEAEKLDIKLQIINLQLALLEPFTESAGISQLNGMINANITANGNLKKPQIDGYLEFDKAELNYDLLNFHVILNDKVYISNNALTFNNFIIEDEHKNKATINGGLYHNNFENIRFDFQIHADNMKILNTTLKDNDMYYGTVFATGDIKIAGNTKSFGIDVIAKTEANTVFVLPMSSVYKQNNVSFLTFVKKDAITNQIIPPKRASEIDLYLKMDIEVTPAAIVQIDFDPKIGDVIRGHAKGNLKMEYDSEDEQFYMYGETEITEGNYLFTLENIINKKFVIKPGGTITWTGDPLNAIIDLNAIYKTRTQLKELLSNVADQSEQHKSANVECNMYLTGMLTKPGIKFDIQIPDGSETVKSQLLTMTQDEINKQFVFLLILNQFYSQNQTLIGETTENKIGTTAGNAFSATSMELLSNQLSNWISQISNNFDIGFKYQPGTEVSGQELEVALSTQILNDRVLINGNLGYGDNVKTNTTTMVGDIEIQYKVNKSGSFRLKGFSRKNDNLEMEYGPYTAGAGIFYTKEFNTFKEMITDIWHGITFKEYREKKKNNKKL